MWIRPPRHTGAERDAEKDAPPERDEVAAGRSIGRRRNASGPRPRGRVLRPATRCTAMVARSVVDLGELRKQPVNLSRHQIRLGAGRGLRHGLAGRRFSGSQGGPLERHLSYQRRACTVTRPGVTDYLDAARVAPDEASCPLALRRSIVGRTLQAPAGSPGQRRSGGRWPEGRDGASRGLWRGGRGDGRSVLALVDSNHHSQIQS